MSDEEKIKRLEYETNYFYIRVLIESLQSDELKMSMLEKIHEEDRGAIVSTITSDDIKLNYINERIFKILQLFRSYRKFNIN